LPVSPEGTNVITIGFSGEPNAGRGAASIRHQVAAGGVEWSAGGASVAGRPPSAVPGRLASPGWSGGCLRRRGR
jgi:hypothetical protein